MTDARHHADLAALLGWYRDMGADEALGEAPIDWLGRGDVAPGHQFRLRAATPMSASPAPPAPAPRQTQPSSAARAPDLPPRAAPPSTALGVPRPFAAVLPDAAILGARGAARAARSLQDLESTLADFDGCSLKATAKNLCFYRGATKSALMLIGEAPGRDEDLAGKPFVGRAGQLLDKMLAAIGLQEEDVHITNIVYWRPPGNRTPTPQEAQVCRPFLERQIELVAPKVIALLGGAAAKHLLDVTDGIMRIRGKRRALLVGTHDAQAMATLHPAYLLRTPAAKRLAWRDLLAIKALLEG
jgi:uracil-DNA glycosylase family 4